VSGDALELSGELELGELLGEGATSVVVAAVVRATGAPVAVKRLRPEHLRDAALKARLLREARAVARLEHPNIVGVHAYGLDRGGAAYVVMERVSGAPLGSGWLTPPTWVELSQVFAQVLSALAVAHAAGVVHRDIKPANVLVGRDSVGQPVVKLLDFGWADVHGSEDDDLTGTQRRVIGTPVYMSPEAAMGDVSPGPAADLYGVGVMMWEVVTGAPPFVEASEAATILAHLNQPLPLLRPRVGLNVPPGLETWLKRSLEKAPDARWRSAAEARDALGALDALGVPSSADQGARAPERDLVSLPGPMGALARALSRLDGEFDFSDVQQQAVELGWDAVTLEVELESLVEMDLLELTPRGAWRFVDREAHRTLRRALGIERARQGEMFARRRAGDAALPAYQDAAALLERAGDLLGAASALRGFADLCRASDPSAATDAYQRAAALFDAEGDPFHAGVCAVQLGRIASDASAWARARGDLSAALERFALYDDPTRTAVVQVMLARAACAMKDAAALDAALDAALALDRAAPLRTSTWATSLEGLAQQCLEVGDAARAARVFALAASARARLRAGT